MTIAEILELKANAGGLQLYLPAKFASDSNSQSLVADGQYLIHCLPGGGFVVLPVERLLDAYPLTVREPPPGALRCVLADDGADFSDVPFSRTDVRTLRDRLRRPDPTTDADDSTTHSTSRPTTTTLNHD